MYDKIKVGVLLIGGEQDTITPPAEMNVIRHYLLNLSPEDYHVSTTDNIRVPVPYVIPDVGHVPMVIHPELVNPVISDFLIKNCSLNTLSGAWQILHKTKGENKWDLKNYEKVNIGYINKGKLHADYCWYNNSGLVLQILLNNLLDHLYLEQ